MAGSDAGMAGLAVVRLVVRLEAGLGLAVAVGMEAGFYLMVHAAPEGPLSKREALICEKYTHVKTHKNTEVG